MLLANILSWKGVGRYAFLGAAVLVFQAMADMASAQDAHHYRVVTGPAGTRSHVAGVGISSLIKVHLMPSARIDLDSKATSGLLESFTMLRDGDTDFALLDAVWSDLGVSDDSLQAVTRFWQEGDRSVQLIVRRDTDEDAVYQITKTIFENLEYLKRLDSEFAAISLDHALDGLAIPLHRGARRYFEQVKALPSDYPKEEPAQVSSLQPATRSITVEGEGASPTATSSGKAFVIYFDLNKADINPQGAAVLDQIAALTDEDLENATVWMAGYTDTLGDPSYNQQLGQRRVEAVRDGLLARGFRAPELYSSAFGERLTWIKTDDETVEARNRRVEVFIEYHD